MSLVGDLHADYGATFDERGGRDVVVDYGRPATTARAVRNGAGTIEMGYGVVVVEGDDRVGFVDDAVTNRVPAADGEGTYALLCDPQGGIETDMYVYNAGERLLLFTPPGRADPLVDDWSGKVFIDDVELRDASAEFGVFGVHGPQATEKVASVLDGAGAPEPALSFVRGRMDEVGVTVVASDALVGEEGYEVVCAADQAADVFDTLLTRGLNAVPFGYATWDALTAEAGTPLFETELEGRLPNVLGLRNAVDFEKGCFVGQEVVSKVENRGQPSKRLVGLRPDERPDAGAAVFDGDASVGEVTRAADSVTLEGPVALALVDFDAEGTDLQVRVDGREVAAERVDLPFVEGSARSERLPTYPE
ncbi:CAF17-like 4Fe-4S cluster assembly/insertion protein YgfZ [Candidatus Halobonum tyrrellensis]|uniref:Glycine cleavage system protein T n=1 Tax=Candidatus Halobonum tyrrellensis G22 TaxID=1324957 RepID=V4HCD1_9EURY|nr:aminomethyltransferase family protein [Candidatus Halobonum tyrrellensis]ESP87718.1 glycine cleavage system protein T [Candidatus Halobonum tyrrellensis G22]